MSNDEKRPRPSFPPAPAEPLTTATVKQTSAAAEQDRDNAQAQGDDKKPAERPSATQLVAGALAAATTTSLLSYIGVAGTIIGAGLASIVTVVGSHLYTASLRRTADRVSAVAPLQRARARGARTTTTTGTRHQGATHGPRPRSETGHSPARADEPGAIAAAAAAAAAPQPRGGKWRAAWRSVVDRYGYRRIVGMVLAVFIAILAAVTLVELAAGKPLSDVVRQERGSGTTIGHTSGGTSEQAPPAPDEPAGPTPAPSEAPSEVPSEEPTSGPDSSGPTEAPTAPSQTGTPAPVEPTPAPTTTPQQTPAPQEAPTDGTLQQAPPRGTSVPDSEPEPAPGE